MNDTLTNFASTLNLTFGPAPKEPLWPPRRSLPRLPRAFVMTDTTRLADPFIIIKKLPRSVAVIFRHYGYVDRQTMADKLVNQAHRQGLKVLISGDVDLARQVNADGVHLPSYMLRTLEAKRLSQSPPSWLTTAAVHNHWELQQAKTLSIDAVLISPVYTTRSRIQRRALGPTGLRRLTFESLIPVFALGGLRFSALTRLKNTGVVGFAGIGEFHKFS